MKPIHTSPIPTECNAAKGPFHYLYILNPNYPVHWINMSRPDTDLETLLPSSTERLRPCYRWFSFIGQVTLMTCFYLICHIAFSCLYELFKALYQSPEVTNRC